MNAVEIEQAITELAEHPFDATEFPFAFLEAVGHEATTIKKLRNGASNKSDIDVVLQSVHIHLKTCDVCHMPATLTDLKDSKATQTKRDKVRFLLVTDGENFEAEDLVTGETVSCPYDDPPNHFVFFWHFSLPPSQTSTNPTPCPKTSVTRMMPTTKCWSASTSADASRTPPNVWKSCSTCTPK
jgi:hypothetical protein